MVPVMAAFTFNR